jgi:hypothetical protein
VVTGIAGTLYARAAFPPGPELVGTLVAFAFASFFVRRCCLCVGDFGWMLMVSDAADWVCDLFDCVERGGQCGHDAVCVLCRGLYLFLVVSLSASC